MVIAKLLLTPKLRAQPLFAPALPQRWTTLVAGSPAGMLPTAGVSSSRQYTSLRLALILTEIVLSTSVARLALFTGKTTEKIVPKGGGVMPVTVVVELAIKVNEPVPQADQAVPLEVQSVKI